MTELDPRESADARPAGTRGAGSSRREALDTARRSAVADVGAIPVSGRLSPERRAPGNGLLVLSTAVVAVICCFGVSLFAAAGGTALLGLAGVALPAAALIGIGAWTVWHVIRER